MKPSRHRILCALFVLLFGGILCACGEKDEVTAPPAGYAYRAGGDLVFGVPYEGGMPIALYDDGTRFRTVPVTPYSFGEHVFYGASFEDKTAYLPQREDGFAVAARPVGGNAIFSADGTVYGYGADGLVTFAPGTLVDTDGDAILYRENETYYLLENGETVRLGAYADGWLCDFAADHEKTGAVCVLLGNGGALTLYEDGVYIKASGKFGTLYPIRDTVLCGYEFTDGNLYLCDPYREWDGALNVTGLFPTDPKTAATVAISPDGQYFLLYDKEFVYRLGAFSDELAVECTPLYTANGETPCDSAVLTGANRAVLTQAPDTVNEFEAIAEVVDFYDDISNEKDG